LIGGQAPETSERPGQRPLLPQQFDADLLKGRFIGRGADPLAGVDGNRFQD